ncbi:hypothetical protein C0J52_04567 [Blattella germanica]|nr:hypothetical protein C0J52_04567 [Blattella germanica]
MITAAHVKATPHERKSQPWFDATCYIERRTIINLQHKARNTKSNEDIKRYNEARKNYKNTLKEKKAKYIESEAEKEVEAATADLALRPKRPTFTQTIAIDVLKEHFHSILNKENKVTAYPVETIVVQKFPKITEEEIATAINSLKQKKASGPDHIYNEHIKATQPLLIDLWVRLFNKCIELNKIPE